MPATTIYDHDSELDLLHKNNMMELKNWLDHLGFIEKDIDRMLQVTADKFSKQGLLYQKLTDKKKENDRQQDVYAKYAQQLRNSLECEDQECDRYYLERHTEFRRIYSYNFDKYNKVKEEFFKVMLNPSGGLYSPAF